MKTTVRSLIIMYNFCLSVSSFLFICLSRYIVFVSSSFSLQVCLCLSICLFFCPSVCRFHILFAYLSVCLSRSKFRKSLKVTNIHRKTKNLDWCMSEEGISLTSFTELCTKRSGERFIEEWQNRNQSIIVLQDGEQVEMNAPYVCF